MAGSAELKKLTSIASRLGAFVAERHPLALADALDALESAVGARALTSEASIDQVRPAFRRELLSRLQARLIPSDLPDTTPRTSAPSRIARAYEEVLDDCDGALRREAIQASLTADERREILRGMVLARATDNRLKAFFLTGEVRFGGAAFQGKGFRSLGQEAIYEIGRAHV